MRDHLDIREADTTLIAAARMSPDGPAEFSIHRLLIHLNTEVKPGGARPRSWRHYVSKALGELAQQRLAERVRHGVYRLTLQGYERALEIDT